jgi:hypothetical protein
MERADIIKALQGYIRDLYYISESERPVRLLQLTTTNDKDLVALLAALTEKHESLFVITGIDSFLASVRRMADPADPALVAYAARFAELEQFLKMELTDLKVLKAGRPEVNIFIVGFTPEKHEAVILHTVAIQT